MRDKRGVRPYVALVSRVDRVKKQKDATSTGLGQNQAEDVTPFMENRLSYYFAAVKAVKEEAR